jgi:hypothetical protein
VYDQPTEHQRQEKLCECGCGTPTPTARTSDAKKGRIKGEPTRFLRGHDQRLRLREGCNADDCNGKHFAGGYCQKHYSRLRRHGNLTGLHPQGPAEERFWRRVDKTGGCWNWTGGRGDHGYGSFTGDGGVAISAHRYSFQLHNGPIPDGLVICHCCDNPACVKPEHLFLGTQRDNVHDMIQKGRRVLGWAARTHCNNGHLYDEANTHIRPDGARRCRACSRSYAKAAATKNRGSR